MMKAGIPSEGGPIGVMLAEHEMGRKYVRNMGKDIEIYKEKGESPLFVENARRYIELLRKYIDKEDY